MSAPIVWIFIPVIIGIILLFFQKFKTAVIISGVFIAINLTLAAWVIPIDEPVLFGSSSYTIISKFSTSNLNFIITNSDRILLILLFGVSVFFMSAAEASRVHRRFVPYCLLIDALIIAAISYKPSIYGILFFLPIIILFVLMLSPPGFEVNPGVLRMLIFQTIGIASVLLVGGIISNNPDILGDSQLIKISVALLGVGFLFLFSIFPLYSWIIKVAETEHPYASVYVFSMMFGGYSLFFSTLIREYYWLFEFADVFDIVGFAGMFMVASGGIWAAFERKLARILGYAVVIEVGYALLSISIENSELQFAMLVPRVISLAVWALGLSVLKSKESNRKIVLGIGRKLPFAAAAIIFANLSLAGLPLLAGFHLQLALLNQLALISSSRAILSFLGSVGLMVGILRSIPILMIGKENLHWESKEDWMQRIFLFFGVVGLFILGVLPNLVFTLISGKLGF